MACPSEATAAMPGHSSWWGEGFLGKVKLLPSRLIKAVNFFRSVAQLVEQRSPKPPVGGSSPS